MHKYTDKLFSEYIRKKSIISGGMVECVTCHKLLHWKNAEAGHFIPRGNLKTRWDERNVHCQCRDCNVFNDGRHLEYENFLIDTYGLNILNELNEGRYAPYIMDDVEISEIRKDLRLKLKELDNAICEI